MYYNVKTAELLTVCPLNGYLEDGTLVQGLNIADSATQKLCGILPVVSDTPAQPPDTYEDYNARAITVGADEVTIVRTWLPNPLVIPETISPRQIRLWLIDQGVALSTVADVINGIEDELLREKTKIEWEFSPYVERSHPMINALGAALGLSSEQIDQAFIDAAQL